MRAYLEITNVCNRSCSFCPGTHRKACFVTPEQFRKRYEQVMTRADIVSLHVLGEPLLHPALEQILSVCRPGTVDLTTNGTLLTEEKQLFLLRAPALHQINFSLQALKEEETFLLERILTFCTRALQERPELYLNLRLWDLESDFSGGRNAFLRKTLSEYFPPAAEAQFSPGRKSFRLEGRLYLHGDSVFEWPAAAQPDRTGEKAFCHALSGQFAVLAEGTVVPCCLDSEGRIPLGNLDDTPLETILSSPRAVRIREGFACGTAAEELCRNCTYRKRFRRIPHSEL